MESAGQLGFFPAERRKRMQEALRSLLRSMGWQSHALERDMMLSKLQRHPFDLPTRFVNPVPSYWFVAGLGFALSNVNFMMAHILELIMSEFEILGLRFIGPSRNQPNIEGAGILFEINTARDVYFYGGAGNTNDREEQVGYQMMSDFFTLMSCICDIHLNYHFYRVGSAEWYKAERVIREALVKGFAQKKGDILLPEGWPTVPRL